MRIASLDFGTNSFLCLIADSDDQGRFHQLHDESVIVRLGQDLQKTGRIQDAALKRAEECLKLFAKRIQDFKVEKVLAVATAAAREAENGKEFEEICQKFQIPLSTISGHEEAELSFRGAIPQQETLKCLVIDIGGGSTEYIVGRAGQIEFKTSHSYGAVKLTEAFIPQQPLDISETKGLREFVKSETEKTWAQIEALRIDKIVAVAGTPTALAAAIIGEFSVEGVEGYVLTRKIIQEWILKFTKTSVEEKKTKFGLGARADIILAGSLILEEMLKRLNFEQLYVSTKGLRYGLAYKMVDSLRSHNPHL